MNKDEIKVNEELVLRLASAAFELHPNTGTWATAYHRRVAAILEGFEGEKVRITPRLQALAAVLADTGVDPVLALDAWRVATGEDLGLESEIYAYMEAWSSEEYKAWADQEAYEGHLQTLAELWTELWTE